MVFSSFYIPIAGTIIFIVGVAVLFRFFVKSSVDKAFSQQEMKITFTLFFISTVLFATSLFMGMLTLSKNILEADISLIQNLSLGQIIFGLLCMFGPASFATFGGIYAFRKSREFIKKVDQPIDD